MSTDSHCPHCDELLEAFEGGMSFDLEGNSDPPGWSLRTPAGEPLNWRDLKTRAEFVLYHGEKNMGTGYIEPNGELALN